MARSHCLAVAVALVALGAGCASEARTLMEIAQCEAYVDRLAAAARRCGETLPDAEIRPAIERLVTMSHYCESIDAIDRPATFPACLDAAEVISCADLAAGNVPAPCWMQLIFYE